MSVEGNKAVLLTQGGDFKQIRNKNYTVGDKVNVRTNYAARIGTIAAALAVFAIGGTASYFTPASYVSVDINPSFLMTLNVYNKVIDVEPLNGEAENLLKKAEVKGMNITDTVDTLIAESERIGYINENGGEVMVSVVPRMRTPKIEDKNTSDNVNLIVSEADKREFDDAKKMGVSIAKAKAIEEYTDAFGGTVAANAGKLGGMTIRQIKSEIDDKKDLEATPAPTFEPSQPAIGSSGSTSAQSEPQISLQSVGTPTPSFTTPQTFAQTPAPQESKPAEVRNENTKPQNADAPKTQPAVEEKREEKAPDPQSAPSSPETSKPAENISEPSNNNGGVRTEDNKHSEPQQNNTKPEDKPQNNTEPAPVEKNTPDSQGSAPSQNNAPSQGGMQNAGNAPAQNTAPKAPSDAPSGGNAPAQPNTFGGSAPSNNGGGPSGGGGPR